MAWLTIAGITVDAFEDGMSQRPMERGGELVRAHAGNLRNSIRWEKRGWDFSTGFMSEAEVTTLRAAVALGAFVTVSGDFVGGASILCEVQINEAPYIANGIASFWRILDIGVTEV